MRLVLGLAVSYERISPGLQSHHGSAEELTGTPSFSQLKTWIEQQQQIYNHSQESYYKRSANLQLITDKVHTYTTCLFIPDWLKSPKKKDSKLSHELLNNYALILEITALVGMLAAETQY